MKKFLFVLIFLVYIPDISFSWEYVKYKFSVLGVNAGEATLKVREESNVYVIKSTIRTYNVTSLFVKVKDDFTTVIDKLSLKTLSRSGIGYIDTNYVEFDRKNNLVKVESKNLGNVAFLNTNDMINDIPTEMFKLSKLDSLPGSFAVSIINITNAEIFNLVKKSDYVYIATNIQGDAYIKLTNVKNEFVMFEASIPAFYVFPFGYLSIFVKLEEIR